jgi:hypothetical protein
MDFLNASLIVLVFMATFAIYDALRKINNNIIEQTNEIKKLTNQIKLNQKGEV